MLTLRSASRHLLQQGDGGSLIVTSSLGALHGTPRNAAYAASKGALTSIVRSLAVELARDQITVNAILPGWIHTAMTEQLLSTDAAQRKILPRIPARRWGTADDFEAIAVLLASRGARYLTGQTIIIDGGYSIF